jgi:hypothetical protein
MTTSNLERGKAGRAAARSGNRADGGSWIAVAIAMLLCTGWFPSDAETAVTPASLTSGGRSTAGTIQLDSSLCDIAGVSTAGASDMRAGYVAQLYERIGLQVLAPSNTIGETASMPLVVVETNDDGTWSRPPGLPAWSVAWGPLVSVQPDGLAWAGVVYADTSAGARAVLGGQTGTVSLLVMDVNADNYGSYAADGLHDGWQIAYFGLGNPLAAPGADPDADRSPNLGEYGSDTNPTNANSVLRLTDLRFVTSPAGRQVHWQGGQEATQYVERSTSLGEAGPAAWVGLRTNIPPTSISGSHNDSSPVDPRHFYRIRAER